MTPVAAFDIFPDGRAVAVPDGDLAPEPQVGAAWRWLHLDRSAEGLRDWVQANLPPTPAAALIQTETRPRADISGDGIVLNLRGVNLNPGSEAEDMVSLRMWVTGRLVVSVRLRRVFAVDAIRQDADQGHAPPSPTAFVAAVARGLAERIEVVSTALDEATAAMEDTVLDDGRPQPHAITIARRRAIRLRRFLAPQRDALNRLAAIESLVIDDAVRPSLIETAHQMARAVEEIDAARDRLVAIMDHLDTLQAARIARNGYVLSVFAAIFLPLGFLTGIWGMNVAGLPGTEWAGAFWVLAGVMVVVAVGLLLVLRGKRWI